MLTSTAVSVVAMVASLVAASWAAVLALAEESPKVARAFVDPTDADSADITRYRRIHVSRLSLLLAAGAGAAEAAA